MYYKTSKNELRKKKSREPRVYAKYVTETLTPSIDTPGILDVQCWLRFIVSYVKDSSAVLFQDITNFHLDRTVKVVHGTFLIYNHLYNPFIHLFSYSSLLLTPSQK